MLDFSVRLSEQFDSSLTWSETPKLEPRRQISRQGPVNQNQDDLFILGRMCGSRGGTGGQDPPPAPDKAQKCRALTILVWIPSIVGPQAKRHPS